MSHTPRTWCVPTTNPSMSLLQELPLTSSHAITKAVQELLNIQEGDLAYEGWERPTRTLLEWCRTSVTMLREGAPHCITVPASRPRDHYQPIVREWYSLVSTSPASSAGSSTFVALPPWHALRVLLTGAGGFIGSHLAERLVHAGARVRAFVHYNSRNDRGLLEYVSNDVQEPWKSCSGI